MPSSAPLRSVAPAGEQSPSGRSNGPGDAVAGLGPASDKTAELEGLQAHLREAGKLSIRCGVSFGEVTRQRIGGPQQQFTVMGSAVNLAQRLESAAAPGTVCTVAEVLDETGTLFEYESDGTHELKGIGPRALFTVTGERERPVQLRGRGQISPLIGREELLEQACAVVEEWFDGGTRAPARDPSTEAHAVPSSATGDDARATGAAHLLILRGPTAVGKSRLAWEVTRRLAAEHPLAVATAHCTPHSGLLGFAAELCKVAGLNADNVAERWAELCVGGTGVLARDADTGGDAGATECMQHLPLLGYVLGSPRVDSAAIRQGDSAAFSAACKGALAACLQLSAHEGRWPLLVVEDIQWLGELADVLAHLLREVRLAPPLVVLATARPSLDEELLAKLAGAEPASAADTAGEDKLPPYTIIEVNTLTQAQGTWLLEALLPGAELPAALEAELHEKSLGLPYYYEEVARMLLRRGVVVEDPVGAARASPETRSGSSTAGDTAVAPTRYKTVGTLDSLPIPDDLRTLILGRLDTLPPQLRELAQHASVLGRSFELPMLLKLEELVSGAAADDVRSALAQLQDERILHADLGGNTGFSEVDDRTSAASPKTAVTDPSSKRYFFTHILTRDAAYASLLSVNKRRLHGAAGDLLATEHVPGTIAEWDLLPLMYEHYKNAGRWKEACDSACDLTALNVRNENATSAGLWSARSAETYARAATDVQLQIHFNWSQGVWRSFLNEPGVGENLLESSLLLARENDLLDWQVRVLVDLGLHYRNRRDYALAEGMLLEAIHTADSVGIHELRHHALLVLGLVYRKQGRLRESIATLEEAATGLRQRRQLGLLCNALISLGNCYTDSDELGKAIGAFEEARGFASTQSNLLLETLVLNNIGVVYTYQDENQKALTVYRRSLQISAQRQWAKGIAYGNLNIGDALVRLKQAEDALPYLDRAVELFQAENDDEGTALSLGTLADALTNCHDWERARASLEAADLCFSRTGDQFRRGLMQCLWARYYLARRETSSAQLALSRAKALGKRLGTAGHSYLESQIQEVELEIVGLA